MPRTERPDMAAYGVPADLDGALDWSWAEERLARSRNFWIATATPDGRPQALPVWGIWLPDVERFVFSCADASRKARNLRANPRIVVTGEDAAEVVSIEGTAEEIDLAAEPEIVGRYAERYEAEPGKRARLAEFLTGTAGFRVVPERAFGIIEQEDRFGPTATRWVW